MMRTIHEGVEETDSMEERDALGKREETSSLSSKKSETRPVINRVRWVAQD